MSKKYIQRALVLVLSLLLALAAFAVPAFADDEAAPAAAAGESAARTFTWTDNEPLVLNIHADEGFRMPEFFLLRINDAEYTVFTTGAENPEGIAYDSPTGKLTVAPALIRDGDSFSLIGSAVGVHVDAEGLTDIVVSADLGRDFSAAKPLELALTPAEGYVLPAELHLVINDILYTVYTDGTVYNDGVAFDPARGVLTVDASYLKIGQTLTLSGAAICIDPDKEAEREQETDPNLYVAVDVTALENITFTDAASNTEMKRGEGNVVTLAPGQDLALSVAPALGTVLPEALSVTIRRADGFVIEETFRFDGKENAQFLAFDPAAQQMRIAANIILNLDAIVIAPVPAPAAEPTTEPTAAPAVEPSAAPAVEPTATPSVEPSVMPTAAPSTAPSAEPTSAPTASPSASPAVLPAVLPSPSPAASPAASPVVSPTVRPSTSPVE